MLTDLNMRHHASCNFTRNGEDIEFKEEEFQEVAYKIAMGDHKFEYCLYSLGLELTFTTPEHKLEVLFPYDQHYTSSTWDSGRATLYIRRK